jgi:multiple sugar transport system substrate-binding protein
MKTDLTRRTLVTAGTALATAGALTGPALLEWARAWAQTVPWKPENGAHLSFLRWKYFVRGEDDAFVAVMNAFAKATDIKEQQAWWFLTRPWGRCRFLGALVSVGARRLYGRYE